MKILAFSDLHCDLGGAARLVTESADADVVIGAGDFASVHEGLTETIDALTAIEKPTILVPGNNETEDALRSACENWPAARVLHGEEIELDGVTFYGLGAGIPTTPWDWSYDLSDEEATERLTGAPDGGVMVLHSPPKGHCDTSGGGESLGSQAIADAIAEHRPEIAVCGHIHESWGCESRLGDTRVLNLGPHGLTLDI